eukprot:2079066-Prymnesium_polylepis.1
MWCVRPARSIVPLVGVKNGRETAFTLNEVCMPGCFNIHWIAVPVAEAEFENDVCVWYGSTGRGTRTGHVHSVHRRLADNEVGL